MSEETDNKIVCESCGWKGRYSQVLRGINPFDTEDHIVGCPCCKDVNPFRGACDEPDCWDHISVGMPAPDGYRQTCSKHQP